MGSIVVGCDGSAYAADAVRWAAQEGRLRGWKVTAVLAWSYLTQPRVPADDTFQPDYGPADADAALQAMLERDVPEIAGELEREVICDLPSRALLEASAEADLLVVGARGLGGFRRALLGSVSQQSVHHSKVPVAIVRSPAPPASGRIVVGIDGSANSKRALAWALDEARVRTASVLVVHAWEAPMYPGLEYVLPPPDIEAMESAGNQLVDRMLHDADTTGLPAHSIDRAVVGASPADAVLDAAKDASLIVVGTRGRGGFANLLLGSVSQHVIHHARCPTVAVPPSAKR